MVIALLKYVVHVSQNKEQLLLYSILTDVLYNRGGVCLLLGTRCVLILYKTDHVSTFRG